MVRLGFLAYLPTQGADIPHQAVDSGTHADDSGTHRADMAPHRADSRPHGPDMLPYGPDMAPHGAESLPHGPDMAPHGADSASQRDDSPTRAVEGVGWLGSASSRPPEILAKAVAPTGGGRGRPTPATQGLRILIGLKMSEEGFEGVVVPAGLFAFASQAA